MSLAEVAALVSRGRRFLVTAHAHPDGDALGSMLATLHGLRALGKEVVAYDHDPPPPWLLGLPGATEVLTAVPTQPFDATLVHDCSDPALLGPDFPGAEVTGPIVVIDHHLSTRPYGQLELCDPGAAAVGVLVARLLDELGVPIDRNIAEALWCSLVSDTGWFRYASTNAEVMRLATRCVEAGCQPWRLARATEEEWPVARTRLLAETLAGLELVGPPGRQAGVLTITDQVLHRAAAPPELADGFVNYARAIAGVEVGVLLAARPHSTRVSLRSKGEVDVAALARRFGGGGHRAAAGCTLEGSPEQSRARLLEALLAVLGEEGA